MINDLSKKTFFYLHLFVWLCFMMLIISGRVDISNNSSKMYFIVLMGLNVILCGISAYLDKIFPNFIERTEFKSVFTLVFFIVQTMFIFLAVRFIMSYLN